MFHNPASGTERADHTSDRSAQEAPGGRFTLAKEKGIWWFKDPEGKPFWSFGVCCTDTGVDPKDVKPDNPGYSALKLFPDPKAWTEDTATKLKAWGFNSLGGWSEADLFQKYAPMPYFTVLHLGAYDRAPWHDLFGDAMAKAVDGAARDQIAKLKDDPNLVGYFTDNELGWWTDTLFPSYLGMPPETKGRKVLLKLIRDHYGNRFARLKKDWITPAKSFAELEKKADLKLRTGGNGIQLVDKWTTTLATRYYSLVRDAVRRYDKTHLILGDRYCQYYDLPVARASMPYIDAVSTNMGADWIDGGTSRFFLDTLHNLAGKPVIITEFYMTAMENQSGNRNSSGGFPIVQTQEERAAAFGKNIAELAERPYMIGAHWFQFMDEPPKGRGDGEDYNMGLVDINGKPYDLLTQVAAKSDLSTRHAEAKPEAAPNTATPAPEEVMKGLLKWDRRRSWVAPSAGTPFGDLYTAWDGDALYLGLYAMDYMDASLYPGGKIPEAELPLLEVKIGGMSRWLRVRYGGAKKEPQGNIPGVEFGQVPGLKYTVVARIPANLLGRKTLAEGTTLAIDARLASHSRAERMAWKREVRLIQ